MQSSIPIPTDATGSGAVPSDLDATQGPTEWKVGTPEWEAMIDRRAALINKKFAPGSGLNDEEEAELERLQVSSSETLERTYPRLRLTPEERALIERVLAGEGSR